MSEPGLLRRAAWLAGCSLAFFAVYGACGAVTARRTDVGTWYHPLELEIPFVPWMIVPYWTSDVLFVGAFLLAPDRRRLDALGKRVLAAIVGAGIGFLLLPLRLGFPRPEVSGAPGFLFEALRSFDGPHNLLPSLHVALCVAWADVYWLCSGRLAGRLGRAVMAGWIALLLASTLLTWQHHVIDLLAGAWLGFLCVHAFRPDAPRSAMPPVPRIGACYAAGAAACVAVAAATWPLGLVLLWPASALGISAAGYLGRGPAIYRKQDGRKPISTRFVMAPCVVGQWASVWWYRRQCRAWDRVTERVWIGSALRRREAERALAGGVRAVLDLTAELDEAAPLLRSSRYLGIPVLDLTAPTEAQLREAVAFVTDRVAAGDVVLVHCKIGYSRSATVVGAWLLATGAASDAAAAVAVLRAARPSLVVRPEALRALEQAAPPARACVRR